MTSAVRASTQPDVNMTATFRVIIEDKATSGAWNMAVDEALLETALESNVPTLRWYQWNEPTLSLGHFQSEDDSTIDTRFASLAKVRRLSGGGAILHDREWTYSISIGPDHPLAAHPGRLYSLVHETIVGVLRDFHVPAQLRGQANETLDHHFLCFSRGDANDVVVGHHKVLGSAQRRRRGAILQHGALLLQASEFAPEFPGIHEFCTSPLDERRLFDTVTRTVADAVDATWKSGTLTDAEKQRAEVLMADEYSRLHRSSKGPSST